LARFAGSSTSLLAGRRPLTLALPLTAAAAPASALGLGGLAFWHRRRVVQTGDGDAHGLLDVLEHHAFVRRAQSNGPAGRPGACCTADTVDIILRHIGQLVI
ncbi:unnamed protein product, partial [Chrysoparadoxa australica]